MSPSDAAIVRHRIHVPAPIAEAFEVFTRRFGDFKPREHNMLRSEIVETVFEPRVGGHIYDRAKDGSECRWARIIAFDPPDRVVFSWNVGPTWQVKTNPELTSEPPHALDVLPGRARPGAAARRTLTLTPGPHRHARPRHRVRY